MFSIRMRAAAGGSHEEGGRHVSGSERLLLAEEVPAALVGLWERALAGMEKPDFIQIRAERMSADEVVRIPPLEVTTCESPQASQVVAGRLRHLGIGSPAIAEALAILRGERGPLEHLHGALLLDADTGLLLSAGERGVRLNRIDLAPDSREAFQAALEGTGLSHHRTREALILASKGAWAGLAAEVGWSDDPAYTTGYVAGGGLYLRIPGIKPTGVRQGGRIFFLQPAALPSFLERIRRPVWVEGTPVIRPWRAEEMLVGEAGR